MKKSLLNLKTMVIAFGVLLSTTASAFTAVTSGNWSSAATWGGVGPGSSVVNSDIIIPSGITVTLDTDVTFNGLLNTFSVSGTLNSTTNNNLNINQGILAGNGTISIHTMIFSSLGTAVFTGMLTVSQLVNASTTASLILVATANITDSLILESGILTLNANSNLSLMTGSTIRVNNGGLAVGGGVFNTANNYNVMYVGTSKTAGVELNGTALQNVTVKLNANSQSLTFANNTTINNNLKIMAGLLNFSGKKITIKGDLSMANGSSFQSNSSSDLDIEGIGSLTSSLVFTSGSSLNSFTLNRQTTVKITSALNISGGLNLIGGTLSLEAGSTLTMNSGSLVHVEGGNLVANSGNFVGTASYNVEYMGTTNSNAGIELSGSGLSNVTVNYGNSTSVVKLTTALMVPGNLNIMNGNVDLNGQNITLNGTFSQNPNTTIIGNQNSEMNLNLSSATNATVFFNSVLPANQTLSKLKVNITGTTAFMIGNTLMIKNELNFIKGKIMIDNADLIIQSTASITGYDDTRYVVTSGTGTGRLQMNVTSGSSFATFPVGTSANYSPAYIQQTSAATSGNIMVKAMNDVLTAGYAGFSAGTLPVVSRTWFIEAESGVTVNMNLKLGWTAAAEINGFDRTNAMIRHYTNNSWDTYATAAATAGANNTYELTRAGITSLSPFAVTDNNAALKVPEITNNNEFKMFPNPAKDFISLKMSTSDTYKYDVIDITGRLVNSTEKTGTVTNINVSDLQPGCYFIKTTNLSNNTSGTKRFVKE